MRLRNVLCLSVILVVVVVGIVLSDVPRFINFQGILLDTAGDPVTTPSNVTFAIWDDLTTGDSLWSETQVVSPDAPDINVFLRSGNA